MNASDEAVRLRKALVELPERLQAILLARMAGDTLEAIGIRLDITKERVRQLEQNGMRHLARLMGVVDSQLDAKLVEQKVRRKHLDFTRHQKRKRAG